MSREGKIHLVESCSFPRATYKNVTNEEKFKELKEAARNFHAGKPRLSEATTFNKMKKVLSENKIDEDVQKRVLEGLQEAGANVDEVELWQFPISKINTKEEPNLNGRVYNEQLWRNVVDKQSDIWKGGCGLANHPADDEDGDFMKQSIVWLDGFIGDDGIVYGIGTLVGDGGALARQIIGVGGRVGFSTSGYGDFLSDGITVDPDDYEIDRFADLVLNPSQGVYGDYRDSYKRAAQTVQESKEGNKIMKESVERKPVALKEDENKKFKIKTGDEEKEFDSFDDFKKELKSHLKKEDEDFDDLDVGEFNDKYSEEDFEGVDSVEVPEMEEETLSEKLIVNYYTEEIKKINKDSNRVYEKKIKKLESLLNKLKKEELKESSKTRINEQINKMLESIEKDIKKAVNEGFDARALCEELEISSLSKLSNIKEKIEDFSSLEDCLVKTTKEANKYKGLYEGKVESATKEAKRLLEKEDEIKTLNEKCAALTKSLSLSENKNKVLAEQVSSLKKENMVQKTTNAKSSLNEKHSKERINKLQEANAQLRSLSNESDKTVSSLREALRKVRTELAEKNRVIAELRRSNGLAENRNAVLKKSLQDTKDKVLSLKEDYRKTLKEFDAEKANRARAERYAKYIDDDFAASFNDDGSIQDYYDQFEGEQFDGMDEAKTLEQAENASIFSNDLLSDEAEYERTSNRRPSEDSEDVMTLSDMFRD